MAFTAPPFAATFPETTFGITEAVHNPKLSLFGSNPTLSRFGSIPTLSRFGTEVRKEERLEREGVEAGRAGMQPEEGSILRTLVRKRQPTKARRGVAFSIV